jgi:hypothetical protein
VLFEIFKAALAGFTAGSVLLSGKRFGASCLSEFTILPLHPHQLAPAQTLRRTGWKGLIEGVAEEGWRNVINKERNCMDSHADPSLRLHGYFQFDNNQKPKQAARITKLMDKAEVRGFGKPDEIREFPKGRVELIKIGGATVGRAVFEPGWRWAESVQPIAKTKSCEAFNITSRASCVYGWMTGQSSTASQATSPCCPPVTTLGLSVMSQRLSSISKA